MPRYFFDLCNGLAVRDPEGTELPNLEAAKLGAVQDIRDLIQASVKHDGTIDLRNHIDVRDERGSIVCVMNFEDAVPFTRLPGRAAPGAT